MTDRYSAEFHIATTVHHLRDGVEVNMPETLGRGGVMPENGSEPLFNTERVQRRVGWED